MNSPIILFAYARLDHLKKTIEALLQNAECISSDLIIYSDAARTHEMMPKVASVREYLKEIKGFKSVRIILREENYGLSRSIINGVSNTLGEYESVIVLEDDIVTSPYFLKYMNEALLQYRKDESVASIHGYVYPVNEVLPDAFFLRGSDCWGWATWRRGWEVFNPNARALLDGLKAGNLIESFDFNGAYGYSRMLESQIRGLNDSWAVRWYASTFLANKLTLYPGRSLVHNIGNDSSGTHCYTNKDYDAIMSPNPIDLSKVRVEESKLAKAAFENFFRKKKPYLASIFANRINAISSRINKWIQ
ncbi:glycosyltransferase family A protein [Polynucleobacter sp. MWH-Jannik1A5]|uniref:glycosyltransferase family A protein n=1 Tax=Polynucleobacter sp. MWH-Jannik1A5 TaxID=1855890 RepID=UPI001C0C7495|nr:glycosyltransferase family A protein [Polynucleobacter sp. MWH-Jannik1A5]MBU3546735.1 glycosyltransferase family 2 protein [Polynucleobacter sp. MWH-Jannik1A5]